MFTGQGSQYVNMGRELYETYETFRSTLDKCDAVVRPMLGEVSLVRDVLFPAAAAASTLVNQTRYTQVALFALEYAVAELLATLGVVPSVVMGHSLGEYVAACVSGIFSLEDALMLVETRARLMGGLEVSAAAAGNAVGVMAAIMATEESVASALKELAQAKPDVARLVSIAAVNAPEQTVISGDRACVTMVLFS